MRPLLLLSIAAAASALRLPRRPPSALRRSPGLARAPARWFSTPADDAESAKPAEEAAATPVAAGEPAEAAAAPPAPTANAGETDWGQIKSTYLGILTQLIMMKVFAQCIMNPASKMLTTVDPRLATVTAAGWFLFIAKQSRWFSPLNASRPERGKAYEPKWTMPTWAPPGITFPIVWSTICVLRCIAGVMVWNACGRSFMAAPLFALYAHLAIGDAWNNLYSVQKRLGAGAGFVWVVLASVYVLVGVFANVLPAAGWVIAPSAVWLTIATALVTRIWQLNGKEPRYPTLA
uniref:Uncharacterized protein n=1 Tax=Phaeomonas parva TaxID=124430 RepID=A0A7S1U214_9STRA|mmetsp:Transcript_28146/g.89967  ORF Transcript_28146/g.89967 Transcript_28146/m.89967 type:complete len:291 (+) Transcript_28146:89-961(+)|eukprot:CAMPEP_0118859328 /NCGR_PEP_ID=MMETSP1163-20130328/5621_1 /TAXON_ID=124430 /ORGANISM="Phaeomonas parva, Strain CCMP2877" /LENGTH=290 /DNA_ID=CAMNT_0006792895 /DNA_START=147 /DNA_END=1019 /DNA_ORIENTATION=-